jgi:hypothetical protein
MTTEDRLHTPEVEEQLARDERARRVVARAKSNKRFMEGIRTSVEARLRGERGVNLEELLKKGEDA